ncbi:hypothetical protein BGK43_10800 [Corynebacterium diphtheriae]|nr:hypothetical protein BGK43_10800 [Corynebacterium diphtheriae]
MLECGVGVHQLESKNTNPRIRKPKVGISAKKSRPAVFVFLSSRRREKERAGKGAPAHRKHEETPAHTFCELGF